MPKDLPDPYKEKKKPQQASTRLSCTSPLYGQGRRWRSSAARRPEKRGGDKKEEEEAYLLAGAGDGEEPLAPPLQSQDSRRRSSKADRSPKSRVRIPDFATRRRNPPTAETKGGVDDGRCRRVRVGRQKTWVILAQELYLHPLFSTKLLFYSLPRVACPLDKTWARIANYQSSSSIMRTIVQVGLARWRGIQVTCERSKQKKHWKLLQALTCFFKN